MKYCLRFWALISVIGLQAQAISGTVHDQVTNGLLAGATIAVAGTAVGTASDENGRFALAELVPGRYTLLVSYVGYEPLKLPDVWVKAGKVTRLDVDLAPDDSNLEAVEVTAFRAVTAPGKIAITEEQINRFAATYYDPARLVTSSPDVAVTNDQNNRISVRGLSPDYNTWRLEGAEIVNPNHLSNAGTFLDQPGATGGGVNLLSAQMLSRSSFLYGTFDNTYVNSTGGIFDMYLKAGTADQRQYTAQASLIGFDLAAEGPFLKNRPVTYSANYRYSFTGLLAGFGVDFGGESIGFQDLSINVSSPLGKQSELNFFVVGGLSSNEFGHLSYDESEVEKDRKDIDYSNKTGIIGVSFKNGFSTGHLTTSVAVSAYDNHRDESGYTEDDQVAYQYNTRVNEQITSMHSRYEGQIGAIAYTAGMMANFYQWEAYFSDPYRLHQFLLAPYFRIRTRFGRSWEGTGGLTYQFSQENSLPDPRISLTYHFNAQHQVSMGAGMYSQLLNPYNYYFANINRASYWAGDYELLRSYRFTISHVYEKAGFSMSTEVFNYYYPEVRVEPVSVSGAPGEQPAGTYGISLLAEQSFAGDSYFRLGGSVFDSALDGENHPYSTGYNVSLAAGKEWKWSDDGKVLGVNLRGLGQGGQYYRDPESFEPEYPQNTAFLYRTTPYWRVDVRLQWTRYRGNRTGTWALDLQNVAAIKNEAYQYYDTFTGQVETQYQLGLIPILAYRVEW